VISSVLFSILIVYLTSWERWPAIRSEFWS